MTSTLRTFSPPQCLRTTANSRGRQKEGKRNSHIRNLKTAGAQWVHKLSNHHQHCQDTTHNQAHHTCLGFLQLWSHHAQATLGEHTILYLECHIGSTFRLMITFCRQCMLRFKVTSKNWPTNHSMLGTYYVRHWSTCWERGHDQDRRVLCWD